jgi:hypothetical protein
VDYDQLISGYKKVLSTLYSPKHFYERIRTFLREYAPPAEKNVSFPFQLHRRIHKINYSTGHYRKREVPLLGTPDLDHVYPSPPHSTGRHPFDLRLPFPEGFCETAWLKIEGKAKREAFKL